MLFICFIPRLQMFYQTKVPTDPAGRTAVDSLPLNLIAKGKAVFPSFNAINTFFPAGVLKATLGKLLVIVVLTLTEPGGTNLDAWAMI